MATIFFLMSVGEILVGVAYIFVPRRVGLFLSKDNENNANKETVAFFKGYGFGLLSVGTLTGLIAVSLLV